MSKPFDNETDSRLQSALQRLDVPADLRERVQRQLQLAARAQSPEAESNLLRMSELNPSPADRATAGKVDKPRFNRRRLLGGMAVAAGLSGVALVYQQLTCPLSQAWLSRTSDTLLAQLRSPSQSLQAIGHEQLASESLQRLRRQIPRIQFIDYCVMDPVWNVQQATAYRLDQGLVALELEIPRGVVGLSLALQVLPSVGNRRLMVAAMASGDKTMVVAGATDLARHILPLRAT